LKISEMLEKPLGILLNRAQIVDFTPLNLTGTSLNQPNSTVTNSKALEN
jgi:hypothetical protein